MEARAGCFVWARLLVRSGRTEGGVDVMGHELVKGMVSGHAEPSSDWEMQQIGRLKDGGVLVSPGHAYHLGAWPREVRLGEDHICRRGGQVEGRATQNWLMFGAGKEKERYRGGY